MQFSKIFAAAGLVAAVSAHQNATVVYTTEVVTALTTFCPAATTLTHGTKTYTVTAPTTLTITNCPCTVTKPVYTSSAVPTTIGTVSVGSTIPGYGNSTTVATAGSKAPTPVGPATTSAAATASASKSATATSAIASAGAGRGAEVAGLAGLVGLAAFLF